VTTPQALLAEVVHRFGSAPEDVTDVAEVAEWYRPDAAGPLVGAT